MDLITTAIVAALSAGATGAISGLTEASKTAIGDAYQALKDLLIRKSGSQSDVVQAITHLEARPDSRGRQATLQEKITAAALEQDADVRASAEHILTIIQPQQTGSGKFIIQNNGPVQGQTIGDNNTITQHFGKRSDA